MKAKVMWTMTLITLLAAAVASCGAIAGGGQSLEGTSWLLIEFNGEGLIPGTRITARFEDGQVRGSSGCNSYGGAYNLKGEEIAIGQVAMTEMACMDPAGVMDQEYNYLEALNNAASVEVSAERMTMLTSDGIALSFISQ